MIVDNELLYKFFAKETSLEEANAIASWAKEKKANEEQFRKAYKLFLLSQFALKGHTLEQMAVKENHRSRARHIAFTSFAWLTAAAAAIVIGVFVSNHYKNESSIKDTLLTTEAKWGKMLTQTLSDGTVIEMNSGSRIEYPAVFLDKERRVKLEGEAIFDVAHNEKQPFIVETFAYDIRVLGTRFDIVANQKDGEFSATLLEGSIEVLDKNQIVRARLTPNQVVKMDENGNLFSAEFDDAKDELAWSDGFISVAGVSFKDIMKRMEKGFGVSIVVDMEQLPEQVLPYGKLRITDGIVSAFDVLKHHFDFEYEFDVQNNLYIIK
jgi:ferric-dicitrate binding protein FerR (iron transport regulator)